MVNNNNLAATCSVSITGKDFVQFTKKYSKVAVLIRKNRGVILNIWLSDHYFYPTAMQERSYIFPYIFFKNLALRLHSLNIMIMITINNSYS